MPLTETLLRAVLAPGCIAGLTLAVGWRPWQRESVADGRWSAPLALGLASFAAYVLLAGLPARPFGARFLAAQEWLAWIALAGGAIAAFQRRLGRAAVLVPLALATALLAGVLGAMRRNYWSAAEATLWQLALALGLGLVWASTAALARRAPGASVPAVLLLQGSAFAATAGLTGSLFLAQLGGALSSALGAALLLTWWRPRVTLAGPGIGIWAVLQTGLIWCAAFYSYLPAGDALLLGAAPLLGWAGSLRPVAARPAWQVVLVRALAVALPAGIALARASLAFEADPYASY